MINLIIFAISSIFVAWLTFVLTALWITGWFQDVRIPFVDAHYERKELKRIKVYNESLLQKHRDYFGEEPVVTIK